MALAYYSRKTVEKKNPNPLVIYFEHFYNDACSLESSKELEIDG